MEAKENRDRPELSMRLPQQKPRISRTWRTFVGIVIFVLLSGVTLWYTVLNPNNNRHLSAPLVIGTNVWPGYEPLYLARTLNFFDPLDFTIAEYSSATQVLRSFRNGTIQVAAITLDEALLLREDGIDVCVILITDISNGGDAVVASVGIETVDQLKGKRIGVENTALGAYVMARALQNSDITLKDITVVPLEIDEQESMITKGEVDAVVTFESVRSRLLKQGATEIFNSSMIPGEIVDVLVVRRELIKTRLDQLTLLLDGWFKALQYLGDQPESSAKLMMPRLQLESNEILASFSGIELPGVQENVEILAGTSPRIDMIAKRLGKFMEDNSLLAANTSIERIGNPDILHKVMTLGMDASSVKGLLVEK